MFLFAAFSVASAVIPAGENCAGEYSVTQCKEDHECRRPDFGKKCVERDFDQTCTCQIIFCQNAEIQLKKLDDKGEHKVCNIGGIATNMFSAGHICWTGCYQPVVDTSSFLGFFNSLAKAVTALEAFVCLDGIHKVNDRNCGDGAVAISEEDQEVLAIASGEQPFLASVIESYEEHNKNDDDNTGSGATR